MIRIVLYLGFVALFVASYLIYGIHRDLIIAVVVMIALVTVGELSSVISRAIRRHKDRKK